MHYSKVDFDWFGVSHQQAVAVQQPSEGPFLHPAETPPCPAGLRLSILVTAAKIHSVAKFLCYPASTKCVVPLVQTQAVLSGRGRDHHVAQ